MGDMAIWAPDYHPYLSISWHVPSDIEVNLASSAILGFLNGAPQSRFHSTLQQIWNFFDPALWKRLVRALLQDPAVWASITNNQTFQELQGRLFTLNAPAIEGTFPNTGSDTQGESSWFSKFIIRWVLDNAMTIISELMKKLGSILGGVLQPTVNGTGQEVNDQSKAALIISLIITIVVAMAFRAFLRSRDRDQEHRT